VDVTDLLGPELLDLATALGLVTGGQLNPHWFDQPLASVGTLLTNDAQRAALFGLLDQVVPAASGPGTSGPGAPGPAKWHPLLPGGGAGNVYLTVDESASPSVIGLAASYTSDQVSLLATLPLVQAGPAGVAAIAGSPAAPAAPLSVSLVVSLAMSDPIALASITATASISTAGLSAQVTLGGLSLDGEAPHDVTLAPADIGAEAAELLVGLLRAQLDSLSGPAGEAAALADNLLQLLGFGSSIPAFPITKLASDPQALSGWLQQLVTGDPAPMTEWLGYLAGLIGSDPPVVTAANQWALPVFKPNGSSSVSLTFSSNVAADGVTPLFGIGAAFSFAAPAAADGRLEIDATFVELPLVGTGSPVVFPYASVTAAAPGDPAGVLVPGAAAGDFSLGAVQGGLSWDGAKLSPLLQLRNVTLGGQSYPVIDLTDAHSVVAAAAAAVLTQLQDALGASPAAGQLMTLAGLTAAAPGASTVDLAQLVSSPLRAIAAVHRNSLATGTPPWSAYFDALLGLAGLPAAAGSGTLADPWVAAIDTAGPVTVQLAAWNAQTSGNPADPQLLRVGIRLQVTAGPANGWWLSELVAVDLPQAAAASVRLLSGHHASVTLQPGSAEAEAGVALSADSIGLTAELVAGSPPALGLTVSNLIVSVPGADVTMASLGFPFPSGFDITNPAASLGISAAELQSLVLGLALRQLSSALGGGGLAVGALFGLSAWLPGLQADFPALGPISWSDPAGSLQAWFAGLAGGLSADGSAFISGFVAWLYGLLAGTLPDDSAAPPDLSGLAGSGTYDDPWVLPIGGSSLAAVLWLDPDGPPMTTGALAEAFSDPPDFDSLVGLLAGAAPLIAPLADGLDPDALSAALQALSDHLSSTDGIVPASAQVPAASPWTAGSPVPAAHINQPADASARAQVMAQLNTWAPAGSRAVLLLGPAFTDHGIWAGLLGDAGSAYTSPSATFNFRLPGVPPTAVDLRSVTEPVDFYTVDLNDDGTGSAGNTASLLTQIGLALAQVSSVRPGVPQFLVAHSTAGLAACGYAAANPAQVHGLITIATPFTGAPITPLTDPSTAEAVRWCAAQLPGGLPAGPLNDALATLGQALDGYAPPPAPGQPAPAWPFGVGDFAGIASADTGGVPALAIPGQLGGAAGVDLLGAIGGAIAAQLTAATPQPPARLGLGLLLDVGLGTGAAAAVAEAWLRLDLFQVPLQPAAAATHPVPALSAGARLYQPGGWLAGGPLGYAGVGAPPVDVRVRSLDLGFALAVSSGASSATVAATLHDAAFHGPTAHQVSWGDPDLEAGLGAVFQALTPTAPDPATPLGGLVGFLQALGIVVPDPHGGLCIASDALTALQASPLAYLGPKFTAALSGGGLLGLGPPSGGVYQWPVPGTGIGLSVSLSPPAVTAGTAAGAPVTLANGITLGFSVSVNADTLAVTASATVGVGPATLTWTPDTLSLGIEGALSPITLIPPPSSAAAEAAFGDAVLQLLVSVAAGGLLGSLLDPGYPVSGLMSFLTGPGAWLAGPNALGNGTILDPAKVNTLLSDVSTALGTPSADGLALPGGLALTAGSAAGPPAATTLSLTTTAPIGGVLGLQLGLAIDAARHVVPSGTVTLDVGTLAGGTWGGLTVSLSAAPSGLSLSITPGAAGTAPIELLPVFSGSAALAGAAQALLPEALTALSGAITIPAPVLDVATALGVYDASATPAWNAAALQALTTASWLPQSRSALITSLVNALNSPALGLPVAAAASGDGNAVALSYPAGQALPAGVASGTLTVTAGWDASSGPVLSVGLQDLQLDQAPVTIGLEFGWASGQPTADGFVGVDLSSAVGIAVTPGLSFGVAAGQPVVSLLPMGNAAAPPVLAVQLIPQFSVQGLGGGSGTPAAAVDLIEQWGLPLAAALLLGVGQVQTELGNPLGGAAGPTAGSILAAAGILTGPAGHYRLASPLPPLGQILAQLAAALPSPADWPSIDLTSDLTLEITADPAGRIGLTLSGTVALTSDGDPQVSLLLGAPATWLGADAGIGLYLFDPASPSSPFAPHLSVRGLGIGVTGGGDDALVSTSYVRIQGLQGYVAFDVDFTATPPSLAGAGGGVDIQQLGLPLGALDPAGSGNPVAASLLGSIGSDSGDPTSAMPAVDVGVHALDGSFSVTFASGQPVVIPVHQSFGPLYIDQIDLSTTGSTSVEVGVDATVQIAGLEVDLDQLGLSVPIATVGDPGTWSLDLQGLAVSFSDPDIDISGGLIKVNGPAGIEYDGMLSVSVAELGITAVGSYARPSDAAGSYTSVFIFATVLVPLGGPPFLFVTGLAGGFGYNRAIQVPTSVTAIPSFVLVEAMNGDGSANDPMSELTQIGSDMPAQRGAYWLAAGLDFTSFALVNSTAIVVVALDRGFEIDIIGVSRMALPTQDLAIASVELALIARYNSQEGVLSVQAQLTDNSYLFDPDCQLTGGFAFFIWFPQGQFVLTLGGYNPAFAKPPQFPDVPRLGFNWDLDSYLVIKGGAYFALTETCVMAGGSLSATLSLGPVSAWLTAYVDFLVSWDPFSYEFDVGSEIGMSLRVRVCFFGCVTIGVTVSEGSQLAISGPPFHGTASIEAYVTTVTFSFGPQGVQLAFIGNWSVFAGKYLTPGDPNQSAVSVQMRGGVLVPAPPGAQPQPGTAAQPWQVGAEFSLVTTSRMPASQVQVSLDIPVTQAAGLNAIDVAPMQKIGVTSIHSLTLTALGGQSGATGDQPSHFTVTAVTGPFPEATWHYMPADQIPAAARTITAVAGLALDAHVALPDQSQVIPIGTLTDDEVALAKPLPFATTGPLAGILRSYGEAADTLLSSVSGAPAAALATATTTVLSGGGVFAQARAGVGLPAAGLPALGVTSLTSRRSAPPLVTSIATGLTLLPVGLAPARLPAAFEPDTPVLLNAPRLTAVLRATPAPAADTEPALRTSVATVTAAAAAPRMAPPTPAAVAGARLVLVPAAQAPRPTTAAVRTRTVRNGDLGAPVGPAEQAVVAAAAADLLAGGVTLGAGVSHLWTVPAATGSFAVTGGGAARVVCADRSGTVLADTEFLAPGSASLPAGTESVVVSCLGTPPGASGGVPAGPGAVELASAPSGSAPVVGWQTSSQLAQVGPASFLGRGAYLSVPQPTASARLGQKASYGMVSGADAVAGQPGVETTLPAGVDVVIIGLDVADASAARDGDLAISVSGATLATPPVRVLAGDRRVLLYPVADRTAGAAAITVAAASASGWSVAAVAGVRGNASEWAAVLAAGLPDQFVPAGPLSPGGSITVTYSPDGGS
jgi:hypothetical protein